MKYIKVKVTIKGNHITTVVRVPGKEIRTGKYV